MYYATYMYSTCDKAAYDMWISDWWLAGGWQGNWGPRESQKVI